MKSHLGIYSDWVEAAKRQAALYPLASPGEETRRQIRNILGFTEAAPVAEDVQLETTWKRDGLAGEGLSWSVGYGPRTQAWFLRPEGTDEPLPGVLSGGGCRAALLQAACDEIGAAAIVGMMTTHPELLNHHVESHTWMFFPPGLATIADWPDLAASRAPSPLLVQYDRDDPLFPIQGMQSAHARIASHYERAGHSSSYVGRFYDGPHKFDKQMQEDAFTWLGKMLRRNSR
jgi:hypothetical protein